jgi:hypothetical protein
MEMLYLGLALGTVGKLILGIAVWRVHAYILREHKIDQVVLHAIRRERYVTGMGILLILLGYAFEMLFYTTSTIIGA